MRLVTVTSIAALVVAIAVLVFVLGLYEELDKSGSDTPLVKKEHTQELNEGVVATLISRHADKLIGLAQSGTNNQEEMDEAIWHSPGYNCIWDRYYDSDTGTWVNIPRVFTSDDYPDDVTYNYIKDDDIWLVNSTMGWVFGCQDLTTWTIDDNTGEVTYGHPDEK